ncbi:MAG TPA: efflux RND transporter permease subunit, partial [Kofleriaceae bacterium]|nr:efflux RND transporter permease subunit [Kofleriaceae bacterium]
HIAQALDHPGLRVDVDRERAAEVGLTQRDVANSMLVSLSSSQLVSPSFWLSPETAVNYSVVVQTPLAHEASVNALLATPVSAGAGSGGGLAGGGSGSDTVLPSQTADSPFAPQPGVARQLGDVAKVTPSQDPALVSHDMVQRVLEVRLSVDGRDLGSVANAIDDVIAQLGKLSQNIKVHVRGQSDSMRSSFRSLELGIILAAALVYLLLVVLFQSFADPLVIIVAVPGALVGVMLMLAITGTTLNVESLMGAIMSIGVATSNSILLVSFANEVREADDDVDAFEAARQAGRTRLRPVLMTALAMILGMLPMAFGFGEGGEQNAPLARAVIGGLSVATVTTLLLVPAAYTLMRKGPPHKPALDRKVSDAEAEDDDGGNHERDTREAT